MRRGGRADGARRTRPSGGQHHRSRHGGHTQLGGPYARPVSPCSPPDGAAHRGRGGRSTLNRRRPTRRPAHSPPEPTTDLRRLMTTTTSPRTETTAYADIPLTRQLANRASARSTPTLLLPLPRVSAALPDRRRRRDLHAGRSAGITAWAHLGFTDATHGVGLGFVGGAAHSNERLFYTRRRLHLPSRAAPLTGHGARNLDGAAGTWSGDGDGHHPILLWALGCPYQNNVSCPAILARRRRRIT